MPTRLTLDPDGDDGNASLLEDAYETACAAIPEDAPALDQLYTLGAILATVAARFAVVGERDPREAAKSAVKDAAVIALTIIEAQPGPTPN